MIWYETDRRQFLRETWDAQLQSVDTMYGVVYDWFVRGWPVEMLALWTQNAPAWIESMLTEFERKYRDAENAVPAV